MSDDDAVTLERSLVEQLLPAYEIEGELGRGAWGIVYGARHRHLARQVAVKQLPRAFGADPDAKRRFVTEARLLASLDHPHIVPVYDYVEDGGLCLLVMERLSGGTLWAKWSAQGLDPAAVVATALAVCSGLQHAHEAGVLHRDIKPENILYASSGRPKLADFGIAKVLADDQAHATRAGDVLGTPAYIAPEQAQGAALGPATDLYSTAVVLYELLAGCLPFAEEGDAMALLWRHVYEEPKQLALVADVVPGRVGDVVMSALAKDPRDRPASAELFAIELAHAATSAWGEGWVERSGVPVELGAAVRKALTDWHPAAPHASASSLAPPPPPPRAAPTVIAPAESRSVLPPPLTVPRAPTTGRDRLAASAAEVARSSGHTRLAALLERVARRTSPPKVTVIVGGSPRSGKSTIIGGLAAVASSPNATELVEVDARAAGSGVHHSLLRGLGAAVDGVVLSVPAGRAVTVDERATLATLARARIPVVLCVTKSDLYPGDVTQTLILHTLRELPGVRFQAVAAELAMGEVGAELVRESGLAQLATVFDRAFARPRIVSARGDAAGWVATAAHLALVDRDAVIDAEALSPTGMSQRARVSASSAVGAAIDAVVSAAGREVAAGLSALARAEQESQWRAAAEALVATLAAAAGEGAARCAAAIDEASASALRSVWEAAPDPGGAATLARWEAGPVPTSVEPARFVTAGLATTIRSLAAIGDLGRRPWELPGVGLTHAAAAHDARLVAGRRRGADALEPIRAASDGFLIALAAGLRATSEAAVDDLVRDISDLAAGPGAAVDDATARAALSALLEDAMIERGG